MIEPKLLLPMLKALADDTRLQILYKLTEGQNYACRINEAFDCSQPTISYHMRVLTDAGLVTAKRTGALVCYELNPGLWDALDALHHALQNDLKEDGE